MTWYVIWSEEHEAWWSPGEAGYTRSLAMAGRYNEGRALEIEERANRHLQPTAGVYHEIAMPDPEDLLKRRKNESEA